MRATKPKLKEIKTKIEILYMELFYVKLEWKLMHNIDLTYSQKDKNHYNNYKIVMFSIKDSLWYSIIMRLSKILDTRDKKSLLSILICIKNDFLIKKMNLFRETDLEFMITNLNSYKSDFDEDGNYLDLFKECRDNYFAHIDEFKSPFEAQQKVLISNNRINLLIDECSKILEELNDKFKMGISSERDNKVIEILELEYKNMYNKIESSFNK